MYLRSHDPAGGREKLKAAIYCRLSKEDEQKSERGQNESESIVNQKSMLTAYALNQGWAVYDIYCDEDYSGADRDRPGFNRLLNDARDHCFDIVLCKTQSRFTRDLELVEKYIHGRFLLWGIRFVSLVDNIDTEIKGNKKARQINGLINEWYLEDLSENIKAVFQNKRKNGYYIGGYPVYGYQKHPTEKGRLVVDPEAARVVQKIYALYLAGNGKQHISVLLNEAHIPNPTTYKTLQSTGYRQGARKNSGYWNRASISRILRDQLYAGDMVQGRTYKPSYKVKHTCPTERDAWVIVPNTHEAIIDRETFETVQRMIDVRTVETGMGDIHLLAGKVRCRDCGGGMRKVTSSTAPDKKRSYLRCKTFDVDKTACCGNHAIRLEALEEAVSGRIRDYINVYYDRTEVEKLARSEAVKNKVVLLRTEAQRMRSEIAKRQKAMRDIYLDRSQGAMDDGLFRELNDGYLREKRTLESGLDRIGAELADLECREDDQSAIKRIDNWLDADCVPRELVADFVDYIEVGQPDRSSGEQEVWIHWLI